MERDLFRCKNYFATKSEEIVRQRVSFKIVITNEKIKMSTIVDQFINQLQVIISRSL